VLHFLAGAVIVGDARTVLAAIDSLIAKPELELRKRRIGLDRLDGTEQLLAIDAIQHRGLGHGLPPGAGPAAGCSQKQTGQSVFKKNFLK
jgi:hypothetical protein